MRLPSSASTTASATARSGCASFGAKPELTDRRAGYFTHVDGVNRFALVALDPTSSREIVAVASFDREDETDRAEYAAAIVDSWQGPWPGAHPSPHLGRLAQERQGPHTR
jgi:hypothetical protein